MELDEAWRSVLAEEVFRALARTAGRLQAELGQLLRQHGLSAPAHSALRIVAGAGEEGIPVRSIRGRMPAPEPDTTRLVDRLAGLGLVERRRSDRDRRIVRVVATAEGRERLAATEAPLARLHDQQLAGLPPDRRRLLRDLLVAIGER